MFGETYKVEVDFTKYTHLIIGDRKIGKTALTADIAREYLGGIQQLYILSIKDERAYKGLQGARKKDIMDYHSLTEELDLIIENGNNLPFKAISIDTIDQLLEIVEDEVLRLSTIETKKVTKTINSAFGGYGAGRKKVIELIGDIMAKLDQINEEFGIMIFLVGHNKIKTIKSKLDIDDYNVVSSNLNEDYFNAFAYRVSIICNIVTEPEIIDGNLKGKLRYLYFKDSGAVLAGTRFKNMPERVPYSAENYKTSVEEGIANSIGDEVIESIPPKSKEVKPKAEKSDKPKVESKPISKDDDFTQEVINECTRLAKEKIVKNKEIMDVLGNYGVKNPKDVPSREIADQILADLKALQEDDIPF